MQRSKIFASYSLILVFLAFTALASAQVDLKTSAQESYRKGDYKNAIKTLQRATKQNAADADAWHLLGASFLKEKKLKEAVKAFNKVLALAPNNSPARVGLAYVYLIQDEDSKAAAEARKAVELDQKNAEAHYLAGVLSLRSASYESAYKSAEKAIAANPQFSQAYLLKSESLAQSAGRLYGVVLKTPDEPARLINEAIESLKIYLKLAPNGADAAARREEIEDLKFLSDYHTRRADQQTPENAGITPLKILEQPRPGYTEAARQAGMTGVIRLRVIFAADGKIRYPMVVNGLGYGLTEMALRAARSIKFQPALKDGSPISTVKLIEYRFAIY